MPELVKQAKPYEHSYGDLFRGEKEIAPFIREYDKTKDMRCNPLCLTHFGLNPFKSISRALGAEGAAKLLELFEHSKYHCEITDRDYHSLIPVALMNGDPETLVCEDTPSFRVDMIKDDNWNMEQFDIENDIIKISHIQQLFLGSGYDMCFSPSDGSHSFLTFTIELDNGDLVICKGIVWHNK